jgi:hypothetical protein
MRRPSSYLAPMLLFCTLSGVPVDATAPPDDTLPTEVRKLVEEQRRQEEEFRREHQRRVRESRERLLAQLKAVQGRYTKDGDLDRAVAVRDEARRLEKQFADEVNLRARALIEAQAIENAVLAERQREKDREEAERGERARRERGVPAEVPLPPDLEVRGQVTAVSETGVIRIDRGRRQGLARGHTLEVYRFDPKPEWAGQLRLVEVGEGEALGVIVTPSNRKVTVFARDEVGTSILPKEASVRK